MDIEKETLITRIAGMIAVGADKPTIAKALKVTVQKVQYYSSLPECRDKVNAILDEATNDVVKKAKNQLAALLPKAVRAIDRKLEEEADLKAAEMVLKGIGVMREDDAPPVATAIQVVLPGGETKEVIEVKE